MSPLPLVPGYPAQPCRVLVVDDDRRVRELLEITLTTHGFAVITACDGEEALMRARRERPDLILLDVRLPKRSGFEVCDVLRNDPTDPAVPIILITAGSEIEHRLQGFTRGADDVMGKPFSPKELVARMNRLLARASESRASARRAVELERELVSARREARRADDDARREESLLAAVSGPGRELLGVLDENALLARLLGIVQMRLGCRSLAALLADPASGTLRAHAVRGDRFERAASLSLPLTGDVATLLQGLARPVRRTELEQLGGSGAEWAPLVSGRWDVLVPVISSNGLEAVIVAEEPSRAGANTRSAWEELGAIAQFAGVALRNARNVRSQARWSLAAAAERVYRGKESAAAFIESRRLLDRACRALVFSPGEHEQARHALALADWARTDDGRRELDLLCESDASGLARGARSLIQALESGVYPEDDRVVVLLEAVEAYRAARLRGLDPEQSRERARAKAAADPFVAECLMASVEAELSPERDAA